MTRYYVVESHSYQDYPDEIGVMEGPFDNPEEAEAAWEKHAALFRHDEDVDIDDDWHRVDIDDGQGGRRTIMIAEQEVRQ